MSPPRGLYSIRVGESRQYAHGDVHTNTVESAFSLPKRGIVGTWLHSSIPKICPVRRARAVYDAPTARAEQYDIRQ